MFCYIIGTLFFIICVFVVFLFFIFSFTFNKLSYVYKNLFVLIYFFFVFIIQIVLIVNSLSTKIIIFSLLRVVMLCFIHLFILCFELFLICEQCERVSVCEWVCVNATWGCICIVSVMHKCINDVIVFEIFGYCINIIFYYYYNLT